MSLLGSPNSDFFGLDIGTTAVRLVQLSGHGPVKTLQRYAYVPLDSNIAMSDSAADQQKLAQTIQQLVTQAKVTTKNVAVGLSSSRVFTTVADVDRLSTGELGQAIRYQADSLIPTPLAESKIDWALLGDSPVDKSKQEILLTSVPNSFVESRLDMLESVGLNVIAFEADNLAIARALTAPEALDMQLLLDMGHKSTDLVIMLGGNPRLTRAIPTGVEAVMRSAMQNLNVDEKQAEQFVLKFGLAKDKLEGQILTAVSGTIDMLVSEVEKSIKFAQTRYPDSKVGHLIVTGGAAIIPEFPLYLANKFGIDVQIGNAWRNISFSRDRQNELLALSNQFSVAAGLAERAE
jgi:type IV pilus assembly protein PilM